MKSSKIAFTAFKIGTISMLICAVLAFIEGNEDAGMGLLLITAILAVTTRLVKTKLVDSEEEELGTGYVSKTVSVKTEGNFKEVVVEETVPYTEANSETTENTSSFEEEVKESTEKRAEYTQNTTNNTTYKRLYKSATDRKVCGVCGGIAEYFNIDPTIIRLIFVLVAWVGGSGVLAYIIAAVVMSERPIN